MEAAIDQSISNRSENLYLLLIFNNDEAIDRERPIVLGLALGAIGLVLVHYLLAVGHGYVDCFTAS